MQGYILNTQKVREEDLLVRVLTPTHIHMLYRFYGRRHSIIHLGNKIDFVIQNDIHEIKKLREPMHLAFSWERDTQKRYYWQQYLKLLNTHLQDISLLDTFYYEHLELGAKWLLKESPKRCILNLYARLLSFEGRNNSLQNCLICGKPIVGDRVLGRGIVCGHQECMQGEVFAQYPIEQWLDFNGEFLNDEEVDRLFNLLQKGL